MQPNALANLLLACAALAATDAEAQTAARRPASAPAPAAVASAPSAGFGTARGPMLTREELRACLTQEAALRKRRQEQEAAKAQLAAEKQAIGDEQTAIRAERTTVEGPDAGVSEFITRSKGFAERLETWNKRFKAFRDSGSSDAGERDALNLERAELEKARAALEAERVQLQTRRQEQVRAYNAKLSALEAKATDWNRRNNAWVDASVTLQADADTWTTDCGNRRYREDDETAIRQGK